MVKPWAIPSLNQENFNTANIFLNINKQICKQYNNFKNICYGFMWAGASFSLFRELGMSHSPYQLKISFLKQFV